LEIDDPQLAGGGAQDQKLLDKTTQFLDPLYFFVVTEYIADVSVDVFKPP
jgi:hypothetical protein